MWKKLSKSLSLTWVWRSGKQSLIFLSTSAFNCEQIEPPVQESFEIPSLLCNHKDVSLSRTFAILRLVYIRAANGKRLEWKSTKQNGAVDGFGVAKLACLTELHNVLSVLWIIIRLVTVSMKCNVD